ncbi:MULTISPECIES: D-2-hydroxyacid dehydrogenase [unclassified Gemella]|uniref:D-2-hydroxyacid dehydrogenase n=1 Tax=unclassified Gemella TaxID=2624949 RepID=UPI001C04E5DC|nr:MULTISPECIES: D-2-hydroxyacid dehydrogenase [unclassified Gemella]MBU0278959.1 D-2-hydroxyacid dehydrogenase [Gemella sp. zg-1178]QWQ39067.1 D-2-hydroxyacid dehydrogenase [Gemella sp. zg-570]
MKLAVFNIREDEKKALEIWREKNFEIELLVTNENLTKDNVELIRGVEGVVLAQNKPFEKEVYDFAKSEGIKVFSTRSAGFDIYDLDLMREYGIKMTNVPSYSPNAIAEHVITTTLYLSRNIKKIKNRVSEHNFSWEPEILSREVRTLTVGVIGTGRIGTQVAKLFNALGAKVIGYDIFKNDEAKKILAYVDNIDDLVAQSDVITLHMPAVKEYKHLVNDDFIAKMKENSIIVNAARGMLVDTKAVLRGLDSGKLLGAALDVYENEGDYVPKDLSKYRINDELLQELINRDDVIYTPHTAFYTTTAIENLVEGGLNSALEVIKTGTSANVVNF